MKKMILLTCLLIIFLTGHVFAMTISAYRQGDANYVNNVDAWIAGEGGATTLLEDFEGEPLGWYGTFTSSTLGTFLAGGQAGTGTSSYSKDGGNSTDIKFSIRTVLFLDSMWREMPTKTETQ